MKEKQENKGLRTYVYMEGRADTRGLRGVDGVDGQ
jgi:hypothetical protein